MLRRAALSARYSSAQIAVNKWLRSNQLPLARREKTRLGGKLRSARDRKRATGVQVEGRRPSAVTHPNAVAMARNLAHGNRMERLSLRKIAAKLGEAGRRLTVKDRLAVGKGGRSTASRKASLERTPAGT